MSRTRKDSIPKRLHNDAYRQKLKRELNKRLRHESKHINLDDPDNDLTPVVVHSVADRTDLS